jgi:hypothetical protein
LEYTDLKTNPPHDVLRVTRDQYLASMDRFRMTEAGISLTPNSEILEWMSLPATEWRLQAIDNKQ